MPRLWMVLGLALCASGCSHFNVKASTGAVSDEGPGGCVGMGCAEDMIVGPQDTTPPQDPQPTYTK